MIKNILMIIALIIIGFDVFMITPFGAFWMMDNLAKGKPCYGILIVFITAIPLALILTYLQ